MKKQELPLVSICIPTYNGAQYIKEAMDSAIEQTYTNLEIIVSDDASHDETLEIILSYSNKTAHPIYIYHHIPQGIGANWNHCVQQSKGEFIKFLFQDDVLEPQCIEKMVDLAQTNVQIGLVYCKRHFKYTAITPSLQNFIDYYKNLHRYWQDISVQHGVISGRKYLKDRQFLNAPKNKIGEPTAVLLNRSCFKEIGWFDETLQQALDSDFWYRVMTRYHIGFIDDCLVSFRLHDKQASITNKQKDIPDNGLIYKRYYDQLFWYLHPKSQLKLLKLYHPLFKTLVKIKKALHV